MLNLALVKSSKGQVKFVEVSLWCYRAPFKGSALCLTCKCPTILKNFLGTNTLAYFASASLTKKRKFRFVDTLTKKFLSLSQQCCVQVDNHFSHSFFYFSFKNFNLIPVFFSLFLLRKRLIWLKLTNGTFNSSNFDNFSYFYFASTHSGNRHWITNYVMRFFFMRKHKTGGERGERERFRALGERTRWYNLQRRRKSERARESERERECVCVKWGVFY